MSKFNCPRCGYSASRKTHLEKHFNILKTCDNIFSDLDVKKYKEVLLLDKGGMVASIIKENESLKKQVSDQNTCGCNGKSGYMYIIYNDMYDEDTYKLGCSHSPEKRINDYATYYPSKSVFKHISSKFKNKLEAEKLVFGVLDEYRVNKKRI